MRTARLSGRAISTLPRRGFGIVRGLFEGVMIEIIRDENSLYPAPVFLCFYDAQIIMKLMILRLYFIPIALVIGSFLSIYILGIYIPNSFQGSVLFSKLSESAVFYAPRVFWIGIFLALLFAICPSFRLYKWGKGETDGTELCPRCGGLTSFKTGRYGPYMKCLACGKNTSI